MPGDVGGSKTFLLKPPHGLTCPITMVLMKDPVMDCLGHSYERRAITQALILTPRVSPYINQAYPDGDAKLQTNFSLRDVIEDYMKEHAIDAGDQGDAEDISISFNECDAENLSTTSKPTLPPHHDHSSQISLSMETA